MRRSKLYLALKGLAYGGSATWFGHDFEAHRDAAKVADVVDEILSIERTMQEHGIETIVFIIPYECQLRTRDPELLHPQRAVSKSLEDRGIEFYDLYDRLERILLRRVLPLQ